MTFWRSRKVLPLVLPIIVCIFLYAVLWQHLVPYNIRMPFFPDALLFPVNGSESDGYAGKVGFETWIKFEQRREANSVPNTDQNVLIMSKAPNVLMNTQKSEIIISYKPATTKKSKFHTPLLMLPEKARSQHFMQTVKGNLNQLKQSTVESYDINSVTLLPILYKKNFTKMPQWDFEDEYLQDAHPQQMLCQSLNYTVTTGEMKLFLQGIKGSILQYLQLWTCQKSVRNSGDVDFRKAFIADIQLFMHHEHLNKSEWNRMSHFNNPYGFMEYSYKDVKQAVDLIPKLKSYQLLPVPQSGCIRCAVVATSGILSGSRMGQEIDSHDYVFRMNGAVTKGYEDDVGNKTSVYVHTSFSLLSSLYLFKKKGHTSIPKDEGIRYVLIPEGLRDYKWLYGLLHNNNESSVQQNIKPSTYYQNPLDLNRFFVLHPDFLRYVKNRFLKSKTLDGQSWPIYRPTNGAYTLFLALHTCDVVDAYGFITADHGKFNNYYYEELTKKTKVIFFGNHDYNLEIKLWKKLHDSKIIKLYQKEEEKTNVTEKENK